MTSADATDRFTSETYDELLSRIDDVRVHRAAFLDELSAGGVALEALFQRAGEDPVLAGMKVLPAVESLPQFGKVQTRRAFAEVGIDEADHISAVSAESIAGLPDALVKHAR